MADSASDIFSQSSLVISRPIMRSVRVAGWSDDVSFDVDQFAPWADPVDVASECMAVDAMCDALRVHYAAAKEKGHRDECVYVIATKDAPVCKIGLTNNPKSRLSCVQNGYWGQLDFAAIFWVYNGAAQLEKRVLQAAKECDAMLKGEWLALRPHIAAMLVAQAAMQTGSEIASSAMWLRGRRALQRATVEKRKGVDHTEAMLGFVNTPVHDRLSPKALAQQSLHKFL